MLMKTLTIGFVSKTSVGYTLWRGKEQSICSLCVTSLVNTGKRLDNLNLPATFSQCINLTQCWEYSEVCWKYSTSTFRQNPQYISSLEYRCLQIFQKWTCMKARLNKFWSHFRSALETDSSCRHFIFPEVLWPFIFLQCCKSSVIAFIQVQQV